MRPVSERQRAAELWAQGYPIKQIAWLTGISAGTIGWWATRDREAFPRRNKGAGWWRAALARCEGVGCTTAARELGCSPQTVNEWRRRLGTG